MRDREFHQPPGVKTWGVVGVSDSRAWLFHEVGVLENKVYLIEILDLEQSKQFN